MPFSTSCAWDGLIKWAEARAACAFSPASWRPHPPSLPPTPYFSPLSCARCALSHHQRFRPGWKHTHKLVARLRPERREALVFCQAGEKLEEGSETRRCAMLTRQPSPRCSCEDWCAWTASESRAHREGRIKKNTANTLWGQAVSQPRCDKAMESTLDQCHMGKYWHTVKFTVTACMLTELFWFFTFLF